MSAAVGNTTIHGGCVSLRGRGILVRGAAGSGKSSLILALVDDPRRDAVLVADDRVVLRRDGPALVAAVPEALRGLIEVRGVGVIRRPFRPEVRIQLVVELLPENQARRFPEPTDARAEIDGVVLPRLGLPQRLVDAALRVRAAAGGARTWPTA